MSDRNPIVDCAIVGAGIAGLVAARYLSQAGHSVAVFDKSRGLGGRVASRRIESATFDHGAQFFTRRSPEFSTFVDQLLENDVAFPWFGEAGKERYAGLPSINQIAKNLAHSLDVTRETRIEGALRDGDCWRLFNGAEVARSRSLLLTCPAPQALPLLAGVTDKLSPSFLHTLAQIEYSKCIALMALLDTPFPVSDSGFKQFDNPEPIATAADTLKKRGFERPGIILQSGPEFAERYFDSEPESITRSILEALPGSRALKIKSVSLQKWRFAKRREHEVSGSFGTDLDRMLWHAGDGYVSPKIEGAYLSGLKAARAIVSALGEKAA